MVRAGTSLLGRQTVDIVYFDAGSGHRSAAIGLASVLNNEYDVEARAVDILEVIDGNRIFKRTVSAGIDYFNFWLRREQVRDLKGLINLSLLCHDLVSRRGVRAIGDYWRRSPTDAVVSVTPMYNPVLARAFHEASPGAPYIVIPVDFEEGKRRYWFDARAEMEYVLTTEAQREQALKVGVARDRLRMASGMIIDPAFYEAPPIDREAVLGELGLDPARPTALISFGGQGSVLVEECARALEGVDRPLNVIALCGRDSELRARLGRARSKHRRLILGFTPEAPVRYHQGASFLIGKPGSMTITEALVTGIPILAIRSRGLAPVQRGNERWVEENRVGEVVPGPADLPAAIERVLDDRAMAGRISRLRHDGVFSAAEIIASRLDVQAPEVALHATTSGDAQGVTLQR